MRENILTDHLKEITNDLNQLELEFGKEEKVLEDKITTLKIHLEEAKRTKEVMKSQILKKEEEVEKLEEEVFTLRIKSSSSKRTLKRHKYPHKLQRMKISTLGC
jgi:chromosome segregation ATPase